MKRAPAWLVVAAWLGLVTGLAEVALLMRRWVLQGRNIHLGRDFFWMTPITDLAVALVLAGLLVLIARLARRHAPPAAVARLVGAAGAAAVLPIAFGWMSWWSLLIVAAGIGGAAGSVAGAHEAGTLAFMRRTVPLLALLAIIVGGFGRGRVLLQERRERAALGPARTGAPNVLVVVWDAVRGRDLSLYGYARETTPNLARLAATGVTFDRAFATASFTGPSHASLFTGRWSHQLRASWLTGLEKGVPTLAEALGREGWRSVAVSANHAYVSWEYGLLRGFDHIDGYDHTWRDFVRSGGLPRWLVGFRPVRRALGIVHPVDRRTADDIREHFLRWIDHGDTARPFFAFLNMYDAHDPYLPPAPYDTLFGFPANGGDAERRRMVERASVEPADAGPGNTQRLRDAYDGGIAYLDATLGRIVEDLRARGQLEKTLIVVVGDHGEAFGEHRLYGHGFSVYREEIRVPLVMALPGTIPAGRRVTGVVSIRDVATTIGDVLGLGGPRWSLPGRSLAFDWTQAGRSDTILTEVEHLPREGQPWFPARRASLRSVLAWPYHLINVGHEVELFDLSADSMEQTNVAHRAEYAAVRDTLEAWLVAARADAVADKPW